MRLLIVVVSLLAATAAVAKERAPFLLGQYATEAQCAKLRKVEAGGPKNVGTAPELLDAEGFHSWEGGCGFTKIFEHEPGQSWMALMICSEGQSINPATYVFVKEDGADAFEVHAPDAENGPEIYTRCDAEKGK